MSVLRYTRAFTLTQEAAQNLAVDIGGIRSRLMSIDYEFFLLRDGDFPDVGDIQEKARQLRRDVTRLMPKADEGKLSATFSRSRKTTLKKFAIAIWDIYQEFTRYMIQNGF